MRVDIPYPEFDSLFRFYNEVWGRLDGRLKKQTRHPLTLTGLQVLTALAQHRGASVETTKSRLATRLGLDRSTLSTTIKALEQKGYVAVQREDGVRNEPVRILPLGKQAMFDGLHARHDVLEEISALMPRRRKRGFFACVEGTHKNLTDAAASARRKVLAKSLGTHAGRSKIKQAPGKHSDPEWLTKHKRAKEGGLRR